MEIQKKLHQLDRIIHVQDQDLVPDGRQTMIIIKERSVELGHVKHHHPEKKVE